MNSYLIQKFVTNNFDVINIFLNLSQQISSFQSFSFGWTLKAYIMFGIISRLLLKNPYNPESFGFFNPNSLAEKQ